MEQGQGQRVLLRRKTTRVTKEQKIGFTMLAMIGGFAIILGSFYISHHLSSPFDIDYLGPEFFTSLQEQQIELEMQKTADTDGDLLSDYDELYVLRTSPYLADTDGDGIDDGTEVENGTDPTCIEGDICESTFGDPYQLDDGSAGFGDLIPVTGTEAPQSPEEIAKQFSEISVDEVRALLLAAGADSTELAEFSDEQLMTLYQSVLADVESQAEMPEIGVPTDTEDSVPATETEIIE